MRSEVVTVCQGRALRSLLGRFRSRRWSILAMVALNLALLPAFVRREVVRLMTNLLETKHTPVGDEPTPEDDPTPLVAAGKVVDLDAERANRTSPKTRSSSRSNATPPDTVSTPNASTS